jgi:hypothetical protein
MTYVSIKDLNDTCFNKRPQWHMFQLKKTQWHMFQLKKPIITIKEANGILQFQNSMCFNSKHLK